MSRSRPASSPLSYHKSSGQYYVTRAGKRIYLGAEQEEALQQYHRLALGMNSAAVPPEPEKMPGMVMTAKELANRFLTSQQANWRDPKGTLKSYAYWLGRFLKDHPKLRAADLTVEMFAAWKVSLRRRKYSPQSINHFLTAVRSLFAFAEEADLMERIPKLKRIKNEKLPPPGSNEKPIYTTEEIGQLLGHADTQLKAMLLLGLNCGFGPKDIQDLTWGHIKADRVTLPRSKTGICQTYLLWPETLRALEGLRGHRRELIERMAKRGRDRTDEGHIFITRFWKPWNKDSVAEQFRRLCKKTKVPCYGFYRLRHCASTAVSLVATPHVQRKFMRHSRLQQQVTYTHAPDEAVDDALMATRKTLLGELRVIGDSQKNPERVGVA